MRRLLSPSTAGLAIWQTAYRHGRSEPIALEAPMLPKAEAAYFAIADISGYTNFLAAVELDHAQDIIADFLDTVVKALRRHFASPNSSSITATW